MTDITRAPQPPLSLILRQKEITPIAFLTDGYAYMTEFWPIDCERKRCALFPGLSHKNLPHDLFTEWLGRSVRE